MIMNSVWGVAHILGQKCCHFFPIREVIQNLQWFPSLGFKMLVHSNPNVVIQKIVFQLFMLYIIFKTVPEIMWSGVMRPPPSPPKPLQAQSTSSLPSRRALMEHTRKIPLHTASSGSRCQTVCVSICHLLS
jgi:hypothetical protein